jgi:hypothetical protein
MLLGYAKITLLIVADGIFQYFGKGYEHLVIEFFSP